jgi:hypothetical protein
VGFVGGRAGKIKNGRCQEIVNFDGEVVWSSFDQGDLLYQVAVIKVILAL